MLCDTFSTSNETHLSAHFVTVLRSWSGEGETGTHQEHAEGLAHDAVEEIQTRVPSHHEEVTEEEELPAAVVQQGVVLAAEQGLVWVLGGSKVSQTPPRLTSTNHQAALLPGYLLSGRCEEPGWAPPARRGSGSPPAGPA